MNACAKMGDKKGFTLVELLVVIGILGILVGIILVSMQAVKKKSRFVSLKSTVSSINSAAVSCAGESQLDAGTMSISAAGTAVCASVIVEPSEYPVLKAGVCDGNAYDVVATDDTSADDDYDLVVSCDIGGEERTVTCDGTGCQ